jgi:hypothetical protein
VRPTTLHQTGRISNNGGTMSRKDTLMEFYYRMKKRLEDNDFDFIIFCQCYESLTHKEGYELSDIYLTDCNNALIRGEKNAKKQGQEVK